MPGFARLFISYLGALTVIASLAGAQEQLFDSASVKVAYKVSCYHYVRYTVITRAERARLGEDIFVRPGGTAACTDDSLPGDYVWRNQWAEYFAGLRDDYLIIDSGTGPDIRGLIVIDLLRRQRVFAASYVALAKAPSRQLLGIWRGYELETPHPGCRTEPGLGPGVDSLFYLNLRTGETRFSGQVRCALRQ